MSAAPSKQHEVSRSGHRPPGVAGEGPLPLLGGQACWHGVISAMTLHKRERWVFVPR